MGTLARRTRWRGYISRRKVRILKWGRPPLSVCFGCCRSIPQRSHLAISESTPAPSGASSLAIRPNAHGYSPIQCRKKPFLRSIVSGTSRALAQQVLPAPGPMSTTVSAKVDRDTVHHQLRHLVPHVRGMLYSLRRPPRATKALKRWCGAAGSIPPEGPTLQASPQSLVGVKAPLMR